MNDDPAPSRLISHLAAVCADARGDLYDTLDVQVAFKREHRPRSVKTIERFEEGNTWPNDPQATVDAYAELTGIPSWELWQMAIDSWRAAQLQDRQAPEARTAERTASGKRIRSTAPVTVRSGSRGSAAPAPSSHPKRKAQ